ncbi:hypothetical protein SAMN04488695_1289 [Proteiniclasticum ruminis]|uniref:Uncharacterized protein n=1 Tax=Proteiniclasticum ruminis TaxID=398199 RepID=A0A1I5F516_9CLOT|nr:hypothetical protein SAMN04488695_1289 [Proteiniclasticum ruminis]
MRKKIYPIIILFSYPITLIILTILRLTTRGYVDYNTIPIVLITISIVIFSLIKYKEL